MRTVDKMALGPVMVGSLLITIIIIYLATSGIVGSVFGSVINGISTIVLPQINWFVAFEIIGSLSLAFWSLLIWEDYISINVPDFVDTVETACMLIFFAGAIASGIYAICELIAILFSKPFPYMIDYWVWILPLFAWISGILYDKVYNSKKIRGYLLRRMMKKEMKKEPPHPPVAPNIEPTPEVIKQYPPETYLTMDDI